MASFIQRTAIISIAKADRIKCENEQKMEIAKETMKKNCTATANEIVKIALKEIDNYVNDRENFAEISWNHSYGKKVVVGCNFSKDEFKTIRSILCNNITE